MRKDQSWVFEPSSPVLNPHVMGGGYVSPEKRIPLPGGQVKSCTARAEPLRALESEWKGRGGGGEASGEGTARAEAQRLGVTEGGEQGVGSRQELRAAGETVGSGHLADPLGLRCLSLRGLPEPRSVGA